MYVLNEPVVLCRICNNGNELTNFDLLKFSLKQ